MGLARLKHREGDLAGELQIYQQALQADPQDAVLLNDVGLCYARAGQSQNALEALQQAVQLKPDSTLYRNNMAAVLIETNRSADAVALLTPTYGTAVAYYNVGYLLQQRGESQAAVDHFTAALAANPSLEPAHDAQSTGASDGPAARRHRTPGGQSAAGRDGPQSVPRRPVLRLSSAVLLRRLCLPRQPSMSKPLPRTSSCRRSHTAGPTPMWHRSHTQRNPWLSTLRHPLRRTPIPQRSCRS